MSENIKSSLIIATYNWKEALELVLISVLNQSVMPYEVIIADDGSKDDTRELIDAYRKKFKIPLIHVWHEDKGFRLSEIRNKSINKATGNYIIQIDGDTILHKDFVKDHQKFARKKQFISGSRVLLGKDFSEKILKSKKFKFDFFSKDIKNKHYHFHIPLLAKILRNPTNDINRVLFSVRGCNMSFWKEDLMAVNGYNEDMTGWGREDSELSARLINLGLTKINLRFSAIQYHIYHPENSKINLNTNDQILAQTITQKKIYIPNGIIKQNSLKKPVIKKYPVTAIVPTFNEAENILEVIDNLNFAGEIIVIDSYSTDKTIELAEQKNVKIIKRKFDDFSSQKNYAIEQAGYDWIFMLDADERISPELRLEIIEKITNPQDYNGFWIPRQNYFLGKRVKFSGWQNDKVIRLFNKTKCRYNGKLVHEKIACQGKTGNFRNPIIHYTYKSYDDYIKKIYLYSGLKALELYRKKIKPNPVLAFIKPLYRFFYHYIIMFGFLDGKTGWTIAKINAIGMRERYRKLKKLYEEMKVEEVRK